MHLYIMIIYIYIYICFYLCVCIYILSTRKLLACRKLRIRVRADFLGHVQGIFSNHFTMTGEKVETLEQFLRNSLAIL